MCSIGTDCLFQWANFITIKLSVLVWFKTALPLNNTTHYHKNEGQHQYIHCIIKMILYLAVKNFIVDVQILILKWKIKETSTDQLEKIDFTWFCWVLVLHEISQTKDQRYFLFLCWTSSINDEDKKLFGSESINSSIKASNKRVE